jgi:hypothetical protein
MSNWWWRARQELDRLEHLEPGWSGYPGSQPVTAANRALALEIMRRLEGLLVLEKTQLSPGEDGSLQLEWRSSDGFFEIYFDVPGPDWIGFATDRSQDEP